MRRTRFSTASLSAVYPRTTPVSVAAITHLSGKGGRVDAAVVLELEEQPVAPGARELGLEGDSPGRPLALDRVDVEEGEIALAQSDQVSVRPQIGLDVDRGAPAGDLEIDLARPLGARSAAPEADLVAVGARHLARRRRGRPVNRPIDVQVAGEGLALPVSGEVREHPVAPGFRQG